jgi:iron complex transport system substrate-binding protein
VPIAAPAPLPPATSLRLLPSVLMMAALGLDAGLAMAQGAAPPQRIVTLSPSLTESVCALGHCDQVVGTDRHSTWPGRVLALPKVGGLEDAQIERIVMLRPDLVLLGPRGRAGERLTALGVPVLSFDARTHADLKRMLLALGAALNEAERAAGLVRRIDADLSAAARRVPAAWRGRRVYVEVGPGPHAAGEKSFIGETLAQLGLVNVIGAELGLFPKINPELIVRHSPDLVIGPAQTLADAAERPGWAAMSALRRRHVCLLDAEQMDLLSRPGPRLGEAAQMLVDCLQALPPSPAPLH